MFHIPGRWHAVATRSGRIDLSQAVFLPGSIASLSRASLQALGVKPRHLQGWDEAREIESPVPFLTLDDPTYPDLLRPVPFAPPVLFYQGRLELLECTHSVAIVGARRCTDNGRRMARELAQSLASAGGVVISGMAHGIDTAAHLAAPGRTIAVLGQGLAARRSTTAGRTARTILEAGGLILSEFLPDVTASRHTFPQRNRIIAAMASLTVVVEAAQRSGAGITARLALEAGRDVGAVPGSPYAQASAGCLNLLAQGAALIRGPEDLLSLLNLSPTRVSGEVECSADPLLRAITRDGTRFDELVEQLAMSPAALGAALSALELEGKITRLAGDKYVPTP